MKLSKTASGKQTVKLSKSDWQSIGKQAGWIRTQSGPEFLRKEAGLAWFSQVIAIIRKIFPKKLVETAKESPAIQNTAETMTQEITAYVQANPDASTEEINQHAQKLMESKRKQLFQETQNAIVLASIKAAEEASSKTANQSLAQSMLGAFVRVIPANFVFGFIDNVIMVLVGESIDANIAQKLQWSTMAAAGLGNATSDIAGVLGAQSIDNALEKINLNVPEVAEKHEKSWAVKFAQIGGGAFGIAAGCVVGMFPLLFSSEDIRVIKTANKEDTK